MFCVFLFKALKLCFCSAFLSILNITICSNKQTLSLISPRDVFLILDLHPAPGEDDGVLLAVAEVEEHPGWTLSN